MLDFDTIFLYKIVFCVIVYFKYNGISRYLIKLIFDILVEFSNPKTLFGHLKLKVELEKNLGKSVDVVEYDSLKPRIKDRVLDSAVSIL